MGLPDANESRPNPAAEAATSRFPATASNYTAHDRLIAALHAAGCKVSRGRSQCPAHGSRGLTLAVKQSPTGVLLHCHAGCTPAEVVDVLGLTLADLFDSAFPPGYTPPPRREPSPWDVVTDGPGWEHLLDRIARERALEQDPAHWDRRARDHENARPRAGDATGQTSTNGLREQWQRLTELAGACREKSRHLAALPEAPSSADAAVWVRCATCGHTAAVAQSVLDRLTTVPASCACGGELR